MHWYDENGLPAYEVEGANGKMRPTTLRDARKLNLVPSVTTVMSVQNKPALINWIKHQILNAVLEIPPSLFEDTSEWKQKVLYASGNTTRIAAENGTLIHDALENGVKTGKIPKNMVDVCKPVSNLLKENFDGFTFYAEDSFTSYKGFGGKVDLYGVKDSGLPTERRLVLDFKTKNKSAEEMEKVRAYDEHGMQTAAYVVGLEETKFKDGKETMRFDQWERYNLFVGYATDSDGDFVSTGVKLTQSLDFDRDWDMFRYLLNFWQSKNKYYPGGTNDFT